MEGVNLKEISYQLNLLQRLNSTITHKNPKGKIKLRENE
jgi:hypothetical protein